MVTFCFAISLYAMPHKRKKDKRDDRDYANGKVVAQGQLHRALANEEVTWRPPRSPAEHVELNCQKECLEATVAQLKASSQFHQGYLDGLARASARSNSASSNQAPVDTLPLEDAPLPLPLEAASLPMPLEDAPLQTAASTESSSSTWWWEPPMDLDAPLPLEDAPLPLSLLRLHHCQWLVRMLHCRLLRPLSLLTQLRLCRLIMLRHRT